MRQQGLQAWVWAVVAWGSPVLFLSSAEEFLGKNPRDESVSFTVEKDQRTGAIYDVQIKRCAKCGQVLSWVRFRQGLAVGGSVREHHHCVPVQPRFLAQ